MIKAMLGEDCVILLRDCSHKGIQTYVRFTALRAEVATCEEY